MLSRLFLVISIVALVSACHGKGKNNTGPIPGPNTGGGYTLVVTGGTLNDGSGVNGLSVLATLRDGQGWGPTQAWTITITGPDIPAGNPLVVEYNDARLGSYSSWEWSGFNPSPGTYRATASNGSTSIYYDFTVTSSVLHAAAAGASSSGGDISLNWPGVAGAGSYFYEVCSPQSVCITGMTKTCSAVASFGTLTTGDYLIEIKAFSSDRPALFADHESAPNLVAHENISEYVFSFPVGGDQTSTNYSFTAAGGILDYGLAGPGGGIYGLAIWTSIQNVSNPGNPSAPSGDWNIKITDPHGMVLSYLYPADERQNTNWYYSLEPASGTYTVTATYGTASKTTTFSLANTIPSLLPLSVTDASSDISASLVSNVTNTAVQDVKISWPAVSGAKSYYVSLYAEVWNNAAKQYDYDEVWAQWTNTLNTRVLNDSIAAGLVCDVYVTAYELDMTASAPPSPAPMRADMSENYYAYTLPFVTQ